MSVLGPLLAVFVIALFGTPAAAADQPTVVRRVLPNGARVLVNENRSAGVVAISLQVRGGSRYETPDTAGITTFLQRALLRGTLRREGAAIAEAAADLGGTVEASADGEHAEVRGRALAKEWRTLLDLVTEVAFQPALAPGEIERERRLLLARIAARAETPLLRGLDALYRDVYGAHPAGLPALGLRESVERITGDSLRAHHARLYRPDQLVLAVSGDVRATQVLEAAARVLGKLPNAAGPDATQVAPPTGPAARQVLESRAHQAHVLVGFVVPGLEAPDYAAVRVLGAILGGGMSGRLFTALRDGRGLAYSLGVVTPWRATPGVLAGYLGTAPDNAETAEVALRDVFERARQEEPTDAELSRAKAYLLGSLATEQRTNARRAWHLAFWELTGAGWDYGDRYAHAVQAVTAADVRAAAGRYLATPAVVVLAPPP